MKLLEYIIYAKYVFYGISEYLIYKNKYWETKYTKLNT